MQNRRQYRLLLERCHARQRAGPVVLRPPAWVDIRPVPASVRRELGITGPAVMIVTPLETVIVTRSGKVYPS